MITTRILYLLERRETGTLSVQEQEELETWYLQQQELNDPLYKPDSDVQDQLLKDQLYDNLMQQVDFHKEERSGRRKLMIRRWSIAASIIFIAGLALYRFYPVEQGPGKELAAVDQPVKDPVVTISNSSNSKQSYYLTDSSRVIISPNSSISYDSSFSNKRREIALQGTAFFDVKKNPNLPFSVSANGVKVIALGTSFTVSSSAADSLLNVELHEGRVVVQTDQATNSRSMKPVYLKPGDEMNIQLATLATTIKTQPVKAKREIIARVKPAPRPASIRFEQEALNTVFDKLATHYNILITYDGQSIRDLDFTGNLQLPDNVLPVLQKLAILNGLTVTAVKNGYHLTKN